MPRTTDVEFGRSRESFVKAEGRKMENEFREQWQALAASANVVLMRPADRRDMQAKCLGVFLPSFEDRRAYTILLPSKSTQLPLGVRRVWRQCEDRAKFESPVIRLRYGPKLEPTIQENEAVLPAAAVESLLGAANRARILASPGKFQWGLDGESSVLEFFGSFLSSRFRWWGGPPSGWEPLRDLHDEIAQVVEDGMAEQ